MSNNRMQARFSTRGILRFVCKAFLVLLAAFILVGIAALKLVERSPDQIKVGFESYLTQMTGYPANVGELKTAKFFPYLVLDMKDLRFWPLDDPDGRVIGVESLTANMPLWSVLAGSPRFSVLSMDGLFIDRSVTGIAPVEIISLRPDAATDTLAAAGKIDGIDIQVAMPLEKTGAGQYRMPQAPVRLSGSLEGGRTKGNVFVDINRDGYGATATFETYGARDMRPVQLLLERWLVKSGKETFPVQLHIEALRDDKGGRSGPYVVPSLRMENGRLQPLECFYNNQGRAHEDKHPCAAYFKEPDTSAIE